MEHERIPTDNPIRHIWNRIDILASISGAENYLNNKAMSASLDIDKELIKLKALGLAYCIRTAREYFQTPIEGHITSACLSYYYGTFSLLKALLISEITNSVTLETIENFTLFGHGLGAVEDDKVGFPHSEYLMVLSNGFFNKFLDINGYDTKQIYVSKRIKSLKDQISDDDRSKLIPLVDILSRIPEIKGIYVDLFKDQPNLLNMDFYLQPDKSETDLSVPIYPNSLYLSEKHILDILDLPKDFVFSREDRYGEEIFRSNIHRDYLEGKSNYRSVMSYDCYVKPILGINDVLLIDFMLLYELSIWVRYRPALWREIIDGKHDMYRPLFTNFLISVERIIPNIVLNRLYNKDFLFAGFSYLS